MIARCSVAAADERVDDGTPTQMQQLTHHIRLVSGGDEKRECVSERAPAPARADVRMWTVHVTCSSLSSKARTALLGECWTFCRQRLVVW